MIIERTPANLLISGTNTVENALRRITENRAKIVLCVSESGHLVGTITDGDFRRWLLANPGSSLAAPSAEIANRNCVSARLGASLEHISSLFRPGVSLIPLVDAEGHLRAVARQEAVELHLGGRTVSQLEPAFLIGEIGINHNGSLDTAKRLIDVAADAGVDSAKFQMRDMDSLYRKGKGDHFAEDLGPQYTLDLLSKFELSRDELAEAFDYCRSVGLIPLCTPWDLSSAGFLSEYGIEGYKVASADLTNHELISVLAESGRPLIVSTGMSSEQEIVESIEVLRAQAATFALLHCNSTYPAPYKDINLLYMRRLRALSGTVVGYSGHERGYHVALAAVTLGAKVIEKHITLDRTSEGSDHKVSLEPDELKAMVREIREVETALGGGNVRQVTQGEMMNRVNLAKSLVAVRQITIGEEIVADMVSIRSPGRGLQPNRHKDLLGTRARRDIAEGDFFYPSDLGERAVLPRKYTFTRPWGLPVRYHDFEQLAESSNPDFLEFHMSYRDLALDPTTMVIRAMPHGLVVHSPDLFSGDHILNLASDDMAVWSRSLRELQRVVDHTALLSTRFSSDFKPFVVASLGGFSRDAPLPRSHRQRLYERVAEGLERIDDRGIEILPQTLPPFPWYMGGQLFCNLFVDPQDTAEFAREYGRRLCLDIAHTKLATNHLGESFSAAVEMLAPLTAHLHIVDAAGVDGEGLQVGDGEVDFAHLAHQLRRLAPTASFIPEIWQGHQNGGEGFWTALERLEGLL